MKKKSKKKIVYYDPPMKYNVALHKFEPGLPTIKKNHTENKIQINPLIILVIIMIITLLIMVYLRF